MNPDTIIIKNDTGVGWGTEVTTKEGVAIDGIRGIDINIPLDDVIVANLDFHIVKLDVVAAPAPFVSCAKCNNKVDFSKQVRMFEQPHMGVGTFCVLCADCDKEYLLERALKYINRRSKRILGYLDNL